MALVIVAFSLLAFGMRTWRLASKSIGYDEGQTLRRLWSGASVPLAGDSSLSWLAAPDGQPPLYYLALRAYTHLAGEGDFALRFLSVAWATLLVPLLWALGTCFGSRRAGLAAALLGVASPLYLRYAQQAQPYVMLAALGLFAVYALDRGLAGQRRAWWVAAALGVVAAISTHHSALVLLPVLGMQALWAGRLRRPWRWAVVVGSLAAAGLLWALYAASPPAEVAQTAAALPATLVAPGEGLRAVAAWAAALVNLVFVALCLLGALWQAPSRHRVQIGRAHV